MIVRMNEQKLQETNKHVNQIKMNKKQQKHVYSELEILIVKRQTCTFKALI